MELSDNWIFPVVLLLVDVLANTAKIEQKKILKE